MLPRTIGLESLRMNSNSIPQQATLGAFVFEVAGLLCSFVPFSVSWFVSGAAVLPLACVHALYTAAISWDTRAGGKVLKMVAQIASDHELVSHLMAAFYKA